MTPLFKRYFETLNASKEFEDSKGVISNRRLKDNNTKAKGNTKSQSTIY